MIKRILVTLLLLSCFGVAHAESRIDLYVGEVKILKLGSIDRIAVGNPKVVSNSLLQNGQLILIGEGEGSSNIHVWFSNGSERDYMIHVSDTATSLVQQKDAVEQLLGDIPGLYVSIVGDRIVLSGQIAFGNEANIAAVKEAFPKVLNSTNFAINDLVRKKIEIEDLLSEVEGLNVRIVGENIVLSGLIDNGYAEAIETVQAAFSELMDLTQRASLDANMPDNKMVLMNIKITEFSKSFTETLGISWGSSVAGPAAAFAFDAENNSVFRPSSDDTFSAGDLPIGSADSPLGYFGIAAELTSRINFAENTGDAVILAEPRLTARSGGEATFLAGGEFPIEISNINGTTIEFKEYGISLTVKPEIDRNNNIRANVMTELSSLDFDVAIGGVPGLLSRKTEADVILKTGETLVMSGLIDQQAAESINGIKFLKDIPILGRLFRSESFRDDKTELVIFVTPEIIDANSQINRDMLDYAEKGINATLENIDRDRLDIQF
ncbi:MAG: pilus assembly protein N-terminal domain-containing protein [Gammaproteobacteria bacterium]